MNCEEIRLIVDEQFLEKEARASSDAMQAHFMTCPDCREYREQHQLILNAFHREAMGSIPTKISKEILEQARNTKKFWPPQKSTVIGLALAAVFSVGVFVFLSSLNAPDDDMALEQKEEEKSLEEHWQDLMNQDEEQAQSETANKGGASKAKIVEGENKKGDSRFDQISKNLSYNVKTKVKSKITAEGEPGRKLDTQIDPMQLDDQNTKAEEQNSAESMPELEKSEEEKIQALEEENKTDFASMDQNALHDQHGEKAINPDAKDSLQKSDKQPQSEFKELAKIEADADKPDPESHEDKVEDSKTEEKNEFTQTSHINAFKKSEGEGDFAASEATVSERDVSESETDELPEDELHTILDEVRGESEQAQEGDWVADGESNYEIKRDHLSELSGGPHPGGSRPGGSHAETDCGHDLAPESQVLSMSRGASSEMLPLLEPSLRGAVLAKSGAARSSSKKYQLLKAQQMNLRKAIAESALAKDLNGAILPQSDANEPELLADLDSMEEHEKLQFMVEDVDEGSGRGGAFSARNRDFIQSSLELSDSPYELNYCPVAISDADIAYE
ncbi:MAG: hypothetical protein H7A33_06310 [Deltaproteobacteria bacterium]|nr:hypothetical protein [Deltaproteobacteria bacterium]